MKKLVNSNIHKIPWHGPQPLGFAAFGHIYVREEFWNDLHSKKPSASSLSILAHEQTHIKRMGSKLMPYIIYWLNRKYRFQEELAAITEEMRVLKKHGEKFGIEKRAKNLSGAPYLWCTRYQIALKEMQSIWKHLPSR
jgi:hypothetical protein